MAGSTRRMPLRSTYAPGTPCWVDLASPDTDASAGFYAGLFGWQSKVDERAEAGGYSTFTLHGHLVAGLGPLPEPEMPASWSVYIDVADAEATAARAIAHGGKVVVEPFEVLDIGQMAVIRDPFGTTFCLWQPTLHHGAELVNEPGAFAWNELATTDLTHASRFYCDVFSWTTPGDRSSQHVVFSLDGASVCGAHALRPSEMPAWAVWFGVTDCDAATETVTELGGSVLDGPSVMGAGRGATVADLHGAQFGIASFG